jgi:hypothetical protein
MSLINFDQLVEFNDGIEGNVSLELDTRTSLENVTITKDDQGVISTDRTAEQTLNFLETEVAPTSPEDASMLASTIEDLKTRVDEEVAQQNNESHVEVSTADQT